MAACGLTALLKEQGVPVAQVIPIMVYLSLGCGAGAVALLLAGVNAFGAALYLLFLASVTPIMHWPCVALTLAPPSSPSMGKQRVRPRLSPPTPARRISAKTGNVKNDEVVHILKNVAIAGGLLLVMFGGRNGAKAKTN